MPGKLQLVEKSGIGAKGIQIEEFVYSDTNSESEQPQKNSKETKATLPNNSDSDYDIFAEETHASVIAKPVAVQERVEQTARVSKKC